MQKDSESCGEVISQFGLEQMINYYGIMGGGVGGFNFSLVLV